MPNNKQTQDRKREPGIRHPEGCPIDGHQGYGCACNPVPAGR